MNKKFLTISLTNLLPNALLVTLTLCQLIQPQLATANSAPKFLTRPISYAKLDVPYAYQAEARDADYDNLTYSALNLSALLTFEHIKTNQVMVSTFAGSQSGFVDGTGTIAQFGGIFGLAVDGLEVDCDFNRTAVLTGFVFCSRGIDN